jgi:hypothetical protein
MTDMYYGTVPALSWILAHYFYGGKHYTWVASEYFPYGLRNPKSSNPHLIYQDIYQPWKDRDDFDRFIQQLRLDLRKGVIAKESVGAITSADATRLKHVCDKVDIVFFYPIVYRVDVDKITDRSRLKVSGSGTRGSSEYLIEDLDESTGEIDEIIFLDYESDFHFKQLVIDERMGVSHTWPPDALATLERRC